MSNQAPLNPELIGKLRALKGNKRPYTFATMLGLSRPTVANALAGLPLQAGTRALLMLRIKELTESNPAPVEGCAA